MKKLFVFLLLAFISVGTSVGVKASDVTAEKPDYEMVDNQSYDFDYTVVVEFQYSAENCNSSFQCEQTISILKYIDKPALSTNKEIWQTDFRITHYFTLEKERLYLDERKSKFLDKYKSPVIFKYSIPISKQV